MITRATTEGGFLHIVDQYLPVAGGAERYCADVSEGLSARGSTVHVFTSRIKNRARWNWENDLPKSDIIKGVHVRRFSALQRGRITAHLLRFCRKRYISHPGSLFELGIMLGEGVVCPLLPLEVLFHAGQYALVHIFGIYSTMMWHAFRSAELARLPVVVTPFLHIEPQGNLRLSWQRKILRSANHIVALTEEERMFLCEEIGIPSERVSTNAPGVCLDELPILNQLVCRKRLGIPEEAFVILFLGRNEERKGIGSLVKAWRILRQEGPRSAFLLMAGRETSYSKRLLSELYYSEGLVVLGEVDREEKIDVLNACDCLVLPSNAESFGIVILEAWAIRKPVIVTRLGTTSEIITDGKDGLLVPYGSVEDLVLALRNLLEHPREAEDMGKIGYRKVIKNYTKDKMILRTEGIYSLVVDQDVRSRDRPRVSE